jgi:hypothetical protein
MIFLIFYFLLFALFLTSGVTWTLERRWKKYLLGEKYSGDTFIWASCLFVVSYIGNIVVYFVMPRVFVYLQLLILAGACVFMMLKEKTYKAEAGRAHGRILDEIAGLQKGLGSDPSNSFCHERLSELFEKLGDMEAAAASAKAAAGLDPTEKNKWRLETLRQGIRGKRSVGGKNE